MATHSSINEWTNTRVCILPWSSFRPETSCDPISAPSTWWRHNEGLWLNEWIKPFPVMLSHANPQCGNTDSLKMDYKHEMYFKYLPEESNMVHTLQSSDPL